MGATFASVALLSAVLAAQPPSLSLREFLDRRLAIGDEEWAAIQAGTPVVKIRRGGAPSETRLMGVVRIEGSPEDLVERYRDIVAFESGTGVLQIGRFSEPPRVEDLASLTFDEEDIEDVKKCRPGDCSIKMSEPMMNAFRGIDWEEPDAVERANQLARTMIVDFLESYRSGGNQALGVLHDKNKPFLVRRQFEEMMADPDLPAYFPDLFRFLLDYPAAALPGSEEFFYWSKVQFGLKPLIRLSHVVIWQPPGPDPVSYVLASKMLYATHYFNTGVELKFLAQERQSPQSYYFVVGNRSRSDGLTGITGSLLGGKIRGEAREGLERYLRSVKSSLEGRLLREVQHRSPDRPPAAVAARENPHVPSRRAIRLAVPFVDHPEGDARDGGAAEDVDLAIALLELMDPSVLAHVHEAPHESFPAFDAAAARDQGHDLRVEERLEIAGPSLEPGAIDGGKGARNLFLRHPYSRVR